MANALSAYNTHVVFYRAFHLSCSVIYINMANALSAHNTSSI